MRRIHKGKYFYDFQHTVENMMKGNPKCFICGSTKNVGPHHLKKVKQNNSLYGDSSNVVLLCKSCHSRYHNHVGKNVNPKSFAVFLKQELHKEMYHLDVMVRTERNKVKRLERELESLRED